MNTKFQLLKRATRFALVLLLLSAAGMTKAFAQKSWTNVRVSASPPNGGTVSGGGYYYYGELVTISASANQGYTFKYWKCNKCGHIVTYQASYSFIWGDGHHHYQGLFGSDNGYYSFTAYFSHIYNITVSANPGNGGTVTGGGTYNEGDSCTLIASPNMGYHFVKWTKNGSQVSTNPTYSFTVTENASYVAQFSSNSCSISATANPTEGGTVTGDGIHNVGETCTLTATPNEGYLFNNWTENGMVVSFNPSYSFTVFGDRTLVANFVEAGSGILNGVFSVSDSIQVNFSQGNLQYQAYTNTWRFALNQYECIGSDNINISATYDGWIDLFGWGTSGYNHGAVCYQPWSTSSDPSDYFAYGDSNCTLYDQTGRADWGYNAISNGGNQTGQWRTLTRPEWYYLFCTRATSSGMRFAKACVNNVNGVILLPDNWDLSYYGLSSMNSVSASYGSNTITAAQWSTLEEHGAVFLPSAGIRQNLTSISQLDARGYYWASNVVSNTNANACCFTPAVDTIWFQNSWRRYYGMSVRLVCSVQDGSYTINATANPAEGGTVTGAGNYNFGDTCTLVATPSAGYIFNNWTKNGAVVSLNPSYSFMVFGDRTLVANFTVCHEYVDLGLPSGLLWATCNVGANIPEEYGDYFAWGETQPKDYYDWNTYHYCNGSENTLTKYCNDSDYGYNGFTDTLTVLLPEDDAARANWGAGWRMPTLEEWQELIDNTTSTWITQNGVNGRLFTAANGASLFLPASGYRLYGESYYAGTYGYSWSSSLTTDSPNFARDFNSTSVNTLMDRSRRRLGESVRAVRESNTLVTVAATPNPAEGGTVSGSGVYAEGTVCTLTATANTGYTFQNWTENGEVVSTETTYSFIVSESVAFVANFAEKGINITQLTSGWNWYSSYIEMDDINGKDSLEMHLGNHGMMIKSQNDGYDSYLSGFGWYGSLNSIRNECMYMVKTSEPCEIGISGLIANIADHPITLGYGQSWIGYPVTFNLSVEDAFAGFTPSSGDILKSQGHGYCSYLEGFGWYGALNTLMPGMGMMYKSMNSESITFTYPDTPTQRDLKPNITAEHNHFVPNLFAYPFNMTVTAVVELDDQELQGENYELAVFANGECRGSARLIYVEPLDRYIAFLTVAGEEAFELRFGLFDAASGMECFDTNVTLIYANDANIGSLEQPFVVSFCGNMGVDEWESRLKVYPNPVEYGQTVVLGLKEETGTVLVEIINALGVVVESVQTQSEQTITVPNVSGIYTLRITVEGKGTCYRRLVVR